MVAGLVLGSLYSLMAGWDPRYTASLFLLAPAGMVSWFVAALLAGVLDIGHGRTRLSWRVAFGGVPSRSRLPGSLLVFWVWSFYLILPIILHWASVLLRYTGQHGLAESLNHHRYASLLYVAISTIMMLVVVVAVVDVWRAGKRVKAQLDSR
jgi:hypothetical protein